MKLLFDRLRDSSIVRLLVLCESPTIRDNDDCNFGGGGGFFFRIFFDEFGTVEFEL
jgi:hypothetical protein